MKLKNNIDKLGTVGLFITAIFSPCCFPIFAFIASAVGLGSFELFGGWTMWIFQVMIIIAIVGFYISYRMHQCMYPLFIAIPSAVLIFYGYHFNNSDYYTYYIYAGMVGLLVATIVNYYRNKLHGACNSCTPANGKNIELISTITCPKCSHKNEETMPTDACQFFYECENCKTRLKPLQGDCCVFCSYGSVKCPPIQAGNKCC
ncbi:MAG: MerC domain-containing protein [Deinococcales bacterium]|nr:MerC domain-containing protein [Chitinophagaceae bacterium]